MDERNFCRRWFSAIFNSYASSDSDRSSTSSYTTDQTVSYKISPGFQLLNVGLHGLAGVFHILSASLALSACSCFTPVTMGGKVFNVACSFVALPAVMVVLIEYCDAGAAVLFHRAIHCFDLGTPPGPRTLIVLTFGLLFSIAASTGTTAVIYTETKEVMSRLGSCYEMSYENFTAEAGGGIDDEESCILARTPRFLKAAAYHIGEVHRDKEGVGLPHLIFRWRPIYDIAYHCFCCTSPVEVLLLAGRTEIVVGFVIVLYILCAIPFIIIAISHGLTSHLMTRNAINDARNTRNARDLYVNELNRLMQEDYEEAVANLYNFSGAEQWMRDNQAKIEGQPAQTTAVLLPQPQTVADCSEILH